MDILFLIAVPVVFLGVILTMTRDSRLSYVIKLIGDSLLLTYLLFNDENWTGYRIVAIVTISIALLIDLIILGFCNDGDYRN